MTRTVEEIILEIERIKLLMPKWSPVYNFCVNLLDWIKSEKEE